MVLICSNAIYRYSQARQGRKTARSSNLIECSYVAVLGRINELPANQILLLFGVKFSKSLLLLCLFEHAIYKGALARMCIIHRYTSNSRESGFRREEFLTAYSGHKWISIYSQLVKLPFKQDEKSYWQQFGVAL